MKEIKAIVQPFMLSKVIGALQQVEGLPGVTVSEVQGFGKNLGQGADGAMPAESPEYAPKAKIEMVVRDDMVEAVVEVILDRAHTGNPGDGKIFVYPIEDVVKIRTRDHGEGAI